MRTVSAQTNGGTTKATPSKTVSPKATRPEAVPTSGILGLLHNAHQRADELWWGAFKSTKLPLTPRQYAVLDAIARRRAEDEDAPVSQTDLVHDTGIDRSTLADIARRLVLRGILVRKRNARDERAYDVALTAKGKSLLAKATPIAQDVTERLIKDLSEPDKAKLANMLARIAEPDAEDEA